MATKDFIEPVAKSQVLSQLCGGRLLKMEGSGHAPQGRIPAKMNLIFKDFIDEALGKKKGQRRCAAGQA